MLTDFFRSPRWTYVRCLLVHLRRVPWGSLVDVIKASQVHQGPWLDLVPYAEDKPPHTHTTLRQCVSTAADNINVLACHPRIDFTALENVLVGALPHYEIVPGVVVEVAQQRVVFDLGGLRHCLRHVAF